MWSFDKRGGDMDRLSAVAKERVMEVLKGEVSGFPNDVWSNGTKIRGL